jgi:hypothetical protein
VFILTFCRRPDLLYGSTLVFKTLRTGFPSARVTVVDNASCSEARREIESQARQCDCAFRQVTGRPMEHHEYIESTISRAARDETGSGPLVLLDPDICFWDSCEDFRFDGLIAGMLFGEFIDGFETVIMPRLHTSFLWIPDPAALADEIRRIRVKRFDFQPFQSVSFRLHDRWYRYDTGASLCAVLGRKVSAFQDVHLDRYDHLFAGCHLDLLMPFLDERQRSMFVEIHARARAGDMRALRGIRRWQADVWNSVYKRPVDGNGRRTEAVGTPGPRSGKEGC